jgi:flagellar basal body-associated protein FliL
MSDDKKKESDSGAAKPEEKKKKKGPNLILIGGILAVLAGNVTIGIIIYNKLTPKKETTEDGKKDKHTQDKKDHHEAEGGTHVGATTADAPVEAVVNVAGTDGERFLKVAIAFEFDDITHPMLLHALEVRNPKIKDILIDYLSKLTIMEVTAPDAKEKIRKDILRLVNNLIPPSEGQIRDVYITNYIIQ